MSPRRHDLSLNETGAELSGDTRFAASIILGLGIDYAYCERHPSGDTLLFRDCTNLPLRLPAYVSHLA